VKCAMRKGHEVAFSASLEPKMSSAWSPRKTGCREGGGLSRGSGTKSVSSNEQLLVGGTRSTSK